MPKYRVPYSWCLSSEMVVEAEDEIEAVRIVRDEGSIGDGGDYVDGSFEVDDWGVSKDFIERKLIFVFGSNLAGRHGLGAARRAHEKYGAMMGIGVGPVGDSYAIPTKDAQLNVLPLETIKKYVNIFLEYARLNPQLDFYVTKIGCGLAGYSEEEIAPLFSQAPINCELRFFKEEELI